jgi:hypothetical protein
VSDKHVTAPRHPKPETRIPKPKTRNPKLRHASPRPHLPRTLWRASSSLNLQPPTPQPSTSNPQQLDVNTTPLNSFGISNFRNLQPKSRQEAIISMASELGTHKTVKARSWPWLGPFCRQGQILAPESDTWTRIPTPESPNSKPESQIPISETRNQKPETRTQARGDHRAWEQGTRCVARPSGALVLRCILKFSGMVSISRFRASGFEFWISGLGFRVSGFGFRVSRNVLIVEGVGRDQATGDLTPPCS